MKTLRNTVSYFSTRIPSRGKRDGRKDFKELQNVTEYITLVAQTWRERSNIQAARFDNRCIRWHACKWIGEWHFLYVCLRISPARWGIPWNLPLSFILSDIKFMNVAINAKPNKIQKYTIILYIGIYEWPGLLPAETTEMLVEINFFTHGAGQSLRFSSLACGSQYCFPASSRLCLFCLFRTIIPFSPTNSWKPRKAALPLCTHNWIPNKTYNENYFAIARGRNAHTSLVASAQQNRLLKLCVKYDSFVHENINQGATNREFH